MKKILTSWVALWIVLTCMVAISSAEDTITVDPTKIVYVVEKTPTFAIDMIPYVEGRLFSDGDVKPLWGVGVRTEFKNLWKGLEPWIIFETGQATTEQSKTHGCNLFNGCSIEQMQNTVKEDDTYWNAKIGVGYRFNLLGK